MPKLSDVFRALLTPLLTGSCFLGILDASLGFPTGDDLADENEFAAPSQTERHSNEHGYGPAPVE
jgi:hypothetical protein